MLVIKGTSVKQRCLGLFVVMASASICLGMQSQRIALVSRDLFGPRAYSIMVHIVEFMVIVRREASPATLISHAARVWAYFSKPQKPKVRVTKLWGRRCGSGAETRRTGQASQTASERMMRTKAVLPVVEERQNVRRWERCDKERFQGTAGTKRRQELAEFQPLLAAASLVERTNGRDEGCRVSGSQKKRGDEECLAMGREERK